jgi:hypothetical protein
MGAIQKKIMHPCRPNCRIAHYLKKKKILENKLSERKNICSLWNINSFNKLNYAARGKKASWEGKAPFPPRLPLPVPHPLPSDQG